MYRDILRVYQDSGNDNDKNDQRLTLYNTRKNSGNQKNIQHKQKLIQIAHKQRKENTLQSIQDHKIIWLFYVLVKLNASVLLSVILDCMTQPLLTDILYPPGVALSFTYE